MIAPKYSDLLQQRSFLRWWFTRLADTAASQNLMVAAGWNMYELMGNAWDLGLVRRFPLAPVLVFTPIAGYVADRFNRAKILTIAMTWWAHVPTLAQRVDPE